jgi:hypothetical protein
MAGNRRAASIPDMNTRVRFSVASTAAVALALAASALVLAAPQLRSGSASTHTVRSASDPTAVRDRVQGWLATEGFAGFKVSEVMAFSNNDYVAVNDKTGKPAFELLTAPNLSWVMEEPASMMWNTKYGMLRGAADTLQPIPGLNMMWGGMMGGSSSMMGSPSSWYSSGTGKVTSLAQAVTVANAWLAKVHSGQKAETDGRAYPGYFTLDTTLNGKTHGMVSVNAKTGTVWYHGWHGTFVSEKMF